MLTTCALVSPSYDESNRDFPGSPVVKTSPSNAVNAGSIPGPGDVINPQARDAIRRGGHYYDKCDWPIFKIGVTYEF